MAVYEEKDGVIVCIIPDMTKEQIIEKSRGNVIMEEVGAETIAIVEPAVAVENPVTLTIEPLAPTASASSTTTKGESNGEV